MEKRHPMKENHFMKEKHSMKKYNRKNLKAIQTIVQEKTGAAIVPERKPAGYKVRQMALLAGSLLCFVILCAFAYAKFSDLNGDVAGFAPAYQGDGRFEIVIVNESGLHQNRRHLGPAQYHQAGALNDPQVGIAGIFHGRVDIAGHKGRGTTVLIDKCLGSRGRAGNRHGVAVDRYKIIGPGPVGDLGFLIGSVEDIGDPGVDHIDAVLCQDVADGKGQL